MLPQPMMPIPSFCWFMPDDSSAALFSLDLSQPLAQHGEIGFDVFSGIVEFSMLFDGDRPLIPDALERLHALLNGHDPAAISAILVRARPQYIFEMNMENIGAELFD